MTETILTIASKISGGGRMGAAAWVARILGPGGRRFPLEREFVRQSRRTSHTGRSGKLVFPIREPGIYELRGVGDFKGCPYVCSVQDGGWSGFIRVEPTGVWEVLGVRHQLTPADVLALIDHQAGA